MYNKGCTINICRRWWAANDGGARIAVPVLQCFHKADENMVREGV